MSRRKYKTREEVCLLFYEKVANHPFRNRRDGKQYKCWWLTKAQTAWLKKVRAVNGGQFYRTEESRAAREWEGVIKYDGDTLIVKAVIAYGGNSRMTVTKESIKS